MKIVRTYDWKGTGFDTEDCVFLKDVEIVLNSKFVTEFVPIKDGFWKVFMNNGNMWIVDNESKERLLGEE